MKKITLLLIIIITFILFGCEVIPSGFEPTEPPGPPTYLALSECDITLDTPTITIFEGYMIGEIDNSRVHLNVGKENTYGYAYKFCGYAGNRLYKSVHQKLNISEVIDIMGWSIGDSFIINFHHDYFADTHSNAARLYIVDERTDTILSSFSFIDAGTDEMNITIPEGSTMENLTINLTSGDWVSTTLFKIMNNE